MAAILPVIAAVSGAIGIAQGIKALSSSNKESAQQAPVQAPAKLPEVPKEEDAQAKAAEELKRRRRISVLSGGQTNVTRGKALVPESAVGTKSLLGQ